MRDHAAKHDSPFKHRTHGQKDGASFQIIVLGPSGGPVEDSVTGMLVRAPQSEWRKSSVIAVDAGAHLASIIRILEQDMPLSSTEKAPPGHKKILKEGPFADIPFPNISAKANSLYFFREMVHSFLITHPHLDHLAGMAINTPALEYGREAKAIVALPSTIEAIKNHIFNDSIWPNLSDEGHGVGFVTYRRLIEGGNPRLGYGEARGYVNVCDGLATKCWSVSHGKCHRHTHGLAHQRGDSFGWAGNDYNSHSRRMSRISDDHGYFAAVIAQQAQNAGSYIPAVPAQMAMPTGQVTPGIPGGTAPASAIDASHLFEPVSSSAFFIRNDMTGQEILVFGDIEPDSVSMSPRNHIVWDDAAPKFANGFLKAIFIECSYDDHVRNEDLYGHLCPRHLIAELTFLAYRVVEYRKQKAAATNETEVNNEIDKSPLILPAAEQAIPASEPKRKRKRTPNGEVAGLTPDIEPIAPLPQPAHNSPYVGGRTTVNSRRKTSHGTMAAPAHLADARPSTPSRSRMSQTGPAPPIGSHQAGTMPITTKTPVLPPNQIQYGPTVITSQTPTMTALQTPSIAPKEKLKDPLKGLNVHIIHVKETLMDGPPPGEVIIEQLKTLSKEAGLGAEFEYTTAGESIWV